MKATVNKTESDEPFERSLKNMLLSSNWLGYKTFNLATRVQIPLGVQNKI